MSIFKRRFLSANKVKRYEAHPLVSRDSDAQHQRYHSTNSDVKPYEMVDFDVLDDPVKLFGQSTEISMLFSSGTSKVSSKTHRKETHET